ncbi:HAD family hydrolase [Corynebacterium glucuronolyticum]|uniref:HAD family hydrolase n=1 Tax=Corynebacterium glucuronolyticum TaxID=39791 RepID=UPI00223AFCB3|nr:HAD family phosphatase [Corynebacterium glucuronolyticum]MCT1441440.1 HAD family phosphatase [Corynebacterium glucuronolyticum]
MTALLFDLYGVVIQHRTPADRARVADQLGVTDGFWETYERTRPPYDAGAISDADWWRALDPSIDLDTALRIEAETLSHAYPAMVNFLSTLKEAGFRIGVLSNLPYVLADNLLAVHPWFTHLDSLTFSCRIGVNKPDPRAYAHALADLGADAEDTLFFDDTQANVTAAREVGLMSALVDRADPVASVRAAMKKFDAIP